MNATNTWVIGGPIFEEQSAVYVSRDADCQIQKHFRSMNYVLLIEPRQQGKTSFINHLIWSLTIEDLKFAFVDVSTLDRSSDETWYKDFYSRIMSQLKTFPINTSSWPSPPKDGVTWRKFLKEIATLITVNNLRLVIVLDEIGAVSFPGAIQCFITIREVYNARLIETEFRQLSFLLSGVFHPRDLIKDELISPFNIAHRIRLYDFTLPQVHGLIAKAWPGKQADDLAQRIYYWTDGQPYIVQRLCSYLSPDATPDNVDAGVERFRREDDNHISPILQRMHNNGKLFDYVKLIQSGSQRKFYPGENSQSQQAQLELLGIIKADVRGNCRIRNRIYEQVLQVLEYPAEPERENGKSFPGYLDFGQKTKLVNALLACSVIRDRNTRDIVVNDLPDSIKNSIQRNAGDRIDVANIVVRCSNFSEGIATFVEIVQFYEGDSTGMRKVQEMVRRLFSDV